MAKSKKTKKAPKVSVARILGFCLLALLAIGAVANVIKALPKEEEPTEEPTILIFTLEDTEYEYEEGMTWEEFINSEYNVAGKYEGSSSSAKFFLLDNNVVYGDDKDNYTDVLFDSEETSCVYGTDLIYSTDSYYFGG